MNQARQDGTEQIRGWGPLLTTIYFKRRNLNLISQTLLRREMTRTISPASIFRAFVVKKNNHLCHVGALTDGISLIEVPS